jgi:hypothetical protein
VGGEGFREVSTVDSDLTPSTKKTLNMRNMPLEYSSTLVPIVGRIRSLDVTT